MNSKERRYDLDWWRVISIFAVYLHHIGMPFNGDDFHIMNEDSSKLLDDVMVFFEQFRLPMLFLISGVGTVFAFQKRNWIQFIKERSSRLLIPLFFGVLVIVPPQTFFENFSFFNSYFDVYGKSFSFEVNHLWFLENLFFLSIFCIPVILFFKGKRFKEVLSALEKLSSKKYGMFLWVLPLIIIKVISKKYFPTDSKDIINLSSSLFYGYFFIAGILIHQSEVIWNALQKYRLFNLKITIVSVIIFYSYYFFPEQWMPKGVSNVILWDIWYIVSTILSWCLIITALGYGQKSLNKKSAILPKLNRAAYPFYIVHQTVIVGVAYYVVQFEWSIFSKIGVLFIISSMIILVLYRLLIFPFKITRFLFGMK